ncbi:MAG: hypothetical protein AAGA62_04140 [Bacteroidota bacterium]
MKRLHLLLLFFCCGAATLTAQVPQGINYQAVARDGNGDLLSDQNVAITFTLRPAGGGTAVYAEDHSPMTNEYGLFTVVIGQGNRPSTNFAEIDWSEAYELGVSVNGNDLGFTPFQSVPYALAAGPRTHLVSVPAGVFTPNNNTAIFVSSVGNGGTEIRETNGSIVTSVLNAPVQLPHGARVTSMTVYFEDNSTSELRIWLAKEFFASGFSITAEVRTTGNEAGIRSETVALNEVIDNEDGGYYLRVFCDDWDAQGRKAIKGVKLSYIY